MLRMCGSWILIRSGCAMSSWCKDCSFLKIRCDVRNCTKCPCYHPYQSPRCARGTGCLSHNGKEGAIAWINCVPIKKPMPSS